LKNKEDYIFEYQGEKEIKPGERKTTYFVEHQNKSLQIKAQREIKPGEKKTSYSLKQQSKSSICVLV